MPTTARGYIFPGNKAVDVPGDMQVLAQSINDDVDTHEDAKTGVHGIPSMASGQGLLWNGSTWIATDLATQTELNTVASRVEDVADRWHDVATVGCAAWNFNDVTERVLRPDLTAIGIAADGNAAGVINLDAAWYGGTSGAEFRVSLLIITNTTGPHFGITGKIRPAIAVHSATGQPRYDLGSSIASFGGASLGDEIENPVISGPFTVSPGRHFITAVNNTGPWPAGGIATIIARLQVHEA